MKTVASQRLSSNGCILGLDMGGTHTDAVILSQGRIQAQVKVRTRHEDLLGSAKEALALVLHEAGSAPSSIQRATFGTTLAVNALVQKSYQPVGLILSAGPGIDPLLFGLGEHVFLMPGALDHRGEERIPPDTTALREQLRQWRQQGLATFAGVSKFSPRNPAHELHMERILQEIFQDGPHPLISLGHRLSGSLNFPRRIATTYWNAAIQPLQNTFADAMEQSLRELGISAPAYLLKADGGAIPLSLSRTVPVEALLSGPAASVMGILALAEMDFASEEDLLVLDMGGTTTDIALLVEGQPVLCPEGLSISGRATLIRSLQSLSIGLGGDSRVVFQTQQNGSHPTVTVGPERTGPAMAFGGSEPTFLDCLNVLGHAQAGETERSQRGLHCLGETLRQDNSGTPWTPREIATAALQQAQQTVANAVARLLADINSRPVYTLAALLKEKTVRPGRALLMGGPAEAVAPLLSKALKLPVDTLGSSLNPVANAVGAGLTRPTAMLELFADTATGRLLLSDADVPRPIDRRYTLEMAQTEARNLLRDRFLADNPSMNAAPPIDVTEAHVFATLDEYGQSGKDIRVRCQIRPGVETLDS